MSGLVEPVRPDGTGGRVGVAVVAAAMGGYLTVEPGASITALEATVTPRAG